MHEKYVEQVDQANQIADEFTTAHIHRIQQKNKPEQVQNPDGTWPHTECIDCDDEIPQGRLALGKVRCIDCQELKEKYEK